MTMQSLRETCRKNGWRGFSGRSKTELLQFMRRKKMLDAGNVIARFFIRRHRLKRRLMSLNTDDVFSGDEINWGVERFLFHTTKNAQLKYYTFRPRELMAYMLCSGKFQNPFTRDDFSDEELARAESLYFRCLEVRREPPLTYTLAIGSNERGVAQCIASPESDFDVVALRAEITLIRKQETASRQLLELLINETTDTLSGILSSLDHADYDAADDALPIFLDQFTSVMQLSTASGAIIRDSAIMGVYDRMESIEHDRFLTILDSMLRCFLHLLMQDSSGSSRAQASVLSQVAVIIYRDGQPFRAVQ
jgi:hypothetical protein